jgi:hypothetical protein
MGDALGAPIWAADMLKIFWIIPLNDMICDRNTLCPPTGEYV